MTGMTRDGTFLVEGGRIVGPVRNLRFTQSYLDGAGGDRRGRRASGKTLRGDFGGVAGAGGPDRRLDVHGRHGALSAARVEPEPRP